MPILVRTLGVLQRSPSVSAIACAVPEGWVDSVAVYREAWGIAKLSWVVVGGGTGLESLWLALKACGDIAADVILVHDGVRPLVTVRVVEENVALARENPAVVTAVPLGETLVRSDGACSSEMVARDGMWRVQTPQTFRRDVLEDVLSRVPDWEYIHEPSAFALYMAQGGSVRIVRGSEANLKVTYSEDISLLRDLFEGLGRWTCQRDVLLAGLAEQRGKSYRSTRSDRPSWRSWTPSTASARSRSSRTTSLAAVSSASSGTGDTSRGTTTSTSPC